MLTVLLGLNDRGKILKLLEDRDFFFPKCNNMLLPGTAWRCAALGSSAHKNDVEEAQAAVWCVPTVPHVSLGVTPPTRPQLCMSSAQVKHPSRGTAGSS